MTTLPKRNPTKKLKSLSQLKRTHVPALTPDSLIVALQRLQELPIHPASKRQLASILVAASNPDGERIDVVVKTISPARQKMVAKTARQVRGITKETTRRGRAKLMALSDEEWEKLVRSD